MIYKIFRTASVSFLLLFLFGCDKEFPVKPESLIGKTKEEVVHLAIAKSARVLNNEVKIAICKPPNGHTDNFYYKTSEEALADSKLMDADIWLVFFTRERSFLRVAQKYIVLTFVDGKVSEYHFEAISDFKF